MQDLLARELEAGAFGLSSGLEYEYGHFATTEEMIELSKVAAAPWWFLHQPRARRSKQGV